MSKTKRIKVLFVINNYSIKHLKTYQNGRRKQIEHL